MLDTYKWYAQVVFARNNNVERKILTDLCFWRDLLARQIMIVIKWSFSLKIFFLVEITLLMCYSSLQNTEAVVRRYFAKKVTLKVLQNSQENTCTGVSFLIKLQAFVSWKPAILLKKSFRYMCFSVNFAKFLRALTL